ncbi:hypothetical protein WMZ06_27155 [Bacillus sp. SW7]|uniref:hypothetical protein n=1 Tax=Bacillus TaxID=1386 RepID=UPI0022E44EA9|nr:hypothetical protein [Bacillus cereus group sp. Bc177]MDA2322670.1 hypothetical protein [Bacillus cereus group sp. Bc177]UBR29381.1 hypothetical protein LCG60_22595 [Bacillus sp. SD-4]
MKDAYEMFLKEFNIDPKALIEFGIKETISIPEKDIETEWLNLQERINGTKKEPVYVRGSGRDAKTTNLYMDLYKTLFPNGTFLKDSTNNAKPKRLLEIYTNCKRGKDVPKKYEQILNYQVSHIFGRTKNPFAFNAPWNFVYLPKVVDPFTGHESHGTLKTAFSSQFKQHFYDKDKIHIEEFNKIMKELEPKIVDYVKDVDSKFSREYTDKMLQKFKKNVLEEFKPIEIL